MTTEYATKTLETARNGAEFARMQMGAAKVGSRKWLQAEEDLHFWQGKIANMEAALAHLGGAR